jgi:hypothetical protein
MLIFFLIIVSLSFVFAVQNDGCSNFGQCINDYQIRQCNNSDEIVYDLVDCNFTNPFQTQIDLAKIELIDYLNSTNQTINLEKVNETLNNSLNETNISLELNLTEFNETNLTLMNETNETMLNVTGYFYWNSTIINNESGKNIPVKMKIPLIYKNMTDEIDSREFPVKNVKSVSDVGFVIKTTFTGKDKLKKLKDNLSEAMNNVFPEVEIDSPTKNVNKIIFDNLTIVNETISLKLNDLNDSRFVQSYEVDPTTLEFSNATMSITAKGTKLYKCSEWDFSTHTCSGTWSLFLEGLVPGENYLVNIDKNDPAFGEINISDAVHLDSDYNEISNIFDSVQSQDDIWSEKIYDGQYVRATFEENLTNGNMINLYGRSFNNKNVWVEIYALNSNVLLGKTGTFSKFGNMQDVRIENLSSPTNIFDLKIVGNDSGSVYLEFDYIHDASRYLTDLSLTPSSASIVESENVNISGSYIMSSTGSPPGDIRIGLNDTNNNLLLDTVCDVGDTFKVENIIQNLCVGCTDNNDGTITILAPSNNEQFSLVWNVSACPDSSQYSPANLLTYELTSTNAVFDNPTGNISIASGPSINLEYPINGSTYNNPNLFFRVNTTGNIDTCLYDFNSAGNVSFNCSQDINITSVDGQNNLSVYANNSLGTWVSDYLYFYLNSSIPLTISITSPSNNSIKTDASPILKLLAYDRDFSSVDYYFDIYYSNGTHYALDGNGTISNNTETEVHLSTELLLVGNLTTYLITAYANDSVNLATSNTLYYTLTTPAITLLSPTNNYWDNDGDINFSFKVYDAAYSNISCSLYLDSVLNQTNSSSLTGGVETTFEVLGTSEGTEKNWKVACTDPSSNYGEAFMKFNVDKTAPSVDSVSDSPDPVDAGQIINITANVSDNFGIDYVQVNVSGALYYMNLAGSEYYYELNTSGLNGNYNYSVIAYDNAGNFGVNNTGSFTVSSGTCTYSGTGNWNINCADNCSISSNVDLLGNNISLIGHGTFITSANITNFTDLFISGDSSVNTCEVYCVSGGCFG